MPRDERIDPIILQPKVKTEVKLGQEIILKPDFQTHESFDILNRLEFTLEKYGDGTIALFKEWNLFKPNNDSEDMLPINVGNFQHSRSKKRVCYTPAGPIMPFSLNFSEFGFEPWDKILPIYPSIDIEGITLEHAEMLSVLLKYGPLKYRGLFRGDFSLWQRRSYDEPQYALFPQKPEPFEVLRMVIDEK